ncbi:MarR family transcriptional regulator [Altererythrobacter sp.]|uniref:MarR family transcriptional regulator n=1 Tax=Altererythrobacter sp. TaxID=1872480 RepID=UPI003CFE96FA
MEQQAKLSAIAEQLARLAMQVRQASLESSSSPNGRTLDGHSHQERYLQLARRYYDERRKRTEIFEDAELFREPAWDILLDLYVAYASGKTVSVSSACIGSAVAPTTALRRLGDLYDLGLIIREQDLFDQRRVLVRLSSRGVSQMEAYFDAISHTTGAAFKAPQPPSAENVIQVGFGRPEG